MVLPRTILESVSGLVSWFQHKFQNRQSLSSYLFTSHHASSSCIMHHEDNLKHKDDLKNEDDLKNKEDLKNEDNIKNEDDLKNEDDVKK